MGSNKMAEEEKRGSRCRLPGTWDRYGRWQRALAPLVLGQFCQSPALFTWALGSTQAPLLVTFNEARAEDPDPCHSRAPWHWLAGFCDVTATENSAL